MADPHDNTRCEPVYDADGRIIATARVSPDMSDKGRRALAELVAAAIRHHESQPPPSPEEQARIGAVRERHQERLRRWRGDAS